MTDRALKDQLEDLLYDIISEVDTKESDDESLLKQIVADLLEGEVVAEPFTAGPTCAEAPLPSLAEYEAKGSKDGSRLEKAVAGLFEDETTAYISTAEVSPYVSTKLEEVENVSEAPSTHILSSPSTPIGQQHRAFNDLQQALPILSGLLLLSLLIGFIWLTPTTWWGWRVLSAAGCLIAVAITVIQWKSKADLASALRAAEDKHTKLVMSQSQLEERIEGLSIANTWLQKSALGFRTVKQFYHTLSSTLDSDELMRRAVELVCNQFDLVYAGLFLVDESGQSAVLQAGTGIRGRLMLKRGYQLEVGGSSAVGWCTANAQAFFAPNPDEEHVDIENTLLPEARSGVTLPLHSSGRVIGALDLQSTQPRAFSREDVDVLQSMADQLAVAIDSARKIAELHTRLAAAEKGHRSRWPERRPGFTLGPTPFRYERTQSGATPASDEAPPVTKEADQAALVKPITLRDEVIGTLGFQEKPRRVWTNHEIALVEDVAGQVALAVENARLFEQTQEALEETSMLYRVSRAIGAAASIPEIANVLLASVAESDFERALVLIGRAGEEELEVVAGWDRHDRPFEVGTLMSVSQVSPELVIYCDPTEGKSLPNCKVLNKTWRRWMTGDQEAALVSVPILFRDQPLGVLLIESHHTDQLVEKALQPFVTLAAQAALTIENRRLFEETRRAAEEEALLNQMLRTMATALDVTSILKSVQESLIQLVPFDYMSLALVDQERSTLEVFHPTLEETGTEHVVPRGQIVPIQETLFGQVITSRNTTVFDLTDHNLHGLEIDTLRHAGIEGAIAVPLVYGRDVLGLLSLGHSDRDAYVTANVPLLERVAQLTAVALENARLFGQLSQRAVQLQTAAQVSQAATSILSLEQLMNQTVELIQDRFNLYYVGLFLVDAANEWAVLRAGTGEAGRIQIEQEHRLKIGGESMIGSCIANAEARVALDVGEEAIHFNNPFLPDTCSEVALPLTSRGKIIGALSVQSTARAAFSREDITTLQTMSDQLANAIQNTRFFEQTQKALAETEALYRASAELNTIQSYEDIMDVLRYHTLLGQGAQNVSLNLFDRPWTNDERPEWIEVAARFSQLPNEAVSPRYPLSAFPSAAELLHPDAPTLIEDVANDPHMDDQARDLYLQRFGAKSTIFVPLVVGGQWIGFINGIYQQATTFPEPEIRRLMGLSGQAAAVVQGLRQLQEIQARARREALIRAITGKIRATTDLETILQTTVTEVSRALGTSHAAIRLGSHAPEECEESLSSERGNGADAPANQSQPDPPSPPKMAEKGGQG